MGKIINLINVDKKEQKYLTGFKVISMDKLSLEQGNKLFLIIINDFKNGNLTLDELSVFGFKIFHGVAKRYPKSDLFQASLSASELNFTIRSEAAYSDISLYLKDIDKFLTKNL
jgi:hypothetical protein